MKRSNFTIFCKTGRLYSWDNLLKAFDIASLFHFFFPNTQQFLSIDDGYGRINIFFIFIRNSLLSIIIYGFL